jgi:hypothetical protein
MKRCKVCKHIESGNAPACPKCGEASWELMPDAAPAPSVSVAAASIAPEPEAPAPAPVPERRRRRL